VFVPDDIGMVFTGFRIHCLRQRCKERFYRKMGYYVPTPKIPRQVWNSGLPNLLGTFSSLVVPRDMITTWKVPTSGDT
jgi:hypothetical protein